MASRILEKRDVQIPLAQHLANENQSPELEVRTSTGLFIDIVTDTEIVECKRYLTLRAAQTAVGQLSMYSLDHPDKSKAIAVWSVKDSSATALLESLGIKLYLLKDISTGGITGEGSEISDDMLEVALLEATANHLSKTPLGDAVLKPAVVRLLLEPAPTMAQLLELVESLATDRDKVEFALLSMASGSFESEDYAAGIETLSDPISLLMLQAAGREAAKARDALHHSSIPLAKNLRDWLDVALIGIVDDWARPLRSIVEANLARVLLACSADPVIVKAFTKD